MIGGGLAGTMICNELIKNSNVTLLEAGAKDKFVYPPVQYIHKNFGAVKTFCIGGGGTTNLWHNGLIPINPHDITLNEFNEILQRAKPFIDNAAMNLYFKNQRFMDEYENLISQINSLAAKLGFSRDGVDCLLYPKKFRKLDADPRVEAFYRVTEIQFDLTQKKVEKVTYKIEDKQYTINPDFVVLSAGTLGTPSLVKRLFRAGGLDDASVGVGLADHPLGFIGKVKAKRAYTKIFRKLSLFDKGNYVCRSAVRLKSDCGKYTCCAFFRPALTMQNKLSIYKYKSLLGASKGIERIKNGLSWKIFHPDILAEIFSHLFGVHLPSSVYNILVVFEQKRGNSQVYQGDNGLIVDWEITPEEIDVYNGILKKLQALLLPVSEKLEIKIPVTEEWLWSAAHHSGTIALGNPDAGGMIDRNLKLHFFENVFICDGSVIQEHSYANTGLTIGQLSMRLSQHLNNQKAA